MKTAVSIIVLLTSVITFGQNKICFTYDDMPVVSYGIDDTTHQEEIIDKLITSLEKNNIPAIGFVNEKKVWNETGINSFQVKLLNKWADSGLELGNHTYSHPDYNNVTFADYSIDLLKGETITKQILYKKEKVLKYFRHPFLHVGNTKEKVDSLEVFLAVHKYKTAPVTIDNDDYLFALAYKRAYVKNDLTMMAQIKNDFINYIKEKIKYYEKQSNALFGRNINHILLLHASLFNSDCVDALADMLIKRNYSFVSIDEALMDEAYKTPVTKFGNWGISWIDRWALSQGKKGEFFKDEPVTPEYIKKLAE